MSALRLARLLVQDVRYQAKYGFYFLYAVMSAFYIGILLLLPPQWRPLGVAVAILTDPAMLGFFFIGGIWLLEQGEGLHGMFAVLPQRPGEYVLSKALSLGILSVLAALVIAVLVGADADYPLLALAVLLGSGVFTLAGLTIATYARSVNHYMLVGTPPMFLFMVPPVLTLFGVSHPSFAVLPGMQLYELLRLCVGLESQWSAGVLFSGIATWLAAAIYVALWRIPQALRGGAQ
ncbi:ABC transporter [Anaerotalea alkaliphila]|uniref:ABC transporter n=1 Tax=Anaerotalea alkaliphila TaxID=2662126 RepID=A0A7X5HTY4_9FIRM|nr:ABC transporter [Anaerotalea alkaliphila]NDL66594.1 ABC transporter [Anaerotalea alkaliphila]